MLITSHVEYYIVPGSHSISATYRREMQSQVGLRRMNTSSNSPLVITSHYTTSPFQIHLLYVFKLVSANSFAQCCWTRWCRQTEKSSWPRIRCQHQTERWGMWGIHVICIACISSNLTSVICIVHNTLKSQSISDSHWLSTLFKLILANSSAHCCWTKRC